MRAMQTRSRRLRGRQHWPSSLLRDGQRIAFAAAHDLMEDAAPFACHLRQVADAQWPPACVQHRPLEHRLRTQFRCMHRRAAALRALEDRWSHASDST
jgi:hypothetical protein